MYSIRRLNGTEFSESTGVFLSKNFACKQQSKAKKDAICAAIWRCFLGSQLFTKHSPRRALSISGLFSKNEGRVGKFHHGRFWPAKKQGKVSPTRKIPSQPFFLEKDTRQSKELVLRVPAQHQRFNNARRKHSNDHRQVGVKLQVFVC
jgi:hypothetical protein